MDYAIENIRKAIREEQARQTEIFKRAIVGRQLHSEWATDINGRLQRPASEIMRYHQSGRLALVYIGYNDMHMYRGATFYNVANVDTAIANAPGSVRHGLTINRAQLGINEVPNRTSKKGLNYYWLSAVAIAAKATDSGEKVDMRAEELAVANNLFEEDNNMTEEPVLWLGEVIARQRSVALEAVEQLEDIIPISIQSHPVSLIP